MKKALNYFSVVEKLLWLCSVIAIAVSFIFFDRSSYITLLASVIGVTSLVLNAKANPVGQLLMVIFSLLYGIISYSFAYYGEMITYLGMTMPMALLSLISWLRHPFKGNRGEVEICRLKKLEHIFMWLLTAAVTVIFYFILKSLNTAKLIPSTVSVITSFLAVYLTFRRSPYYALAYAANDIVLIILWSMAALYETRYISVTVCFTAFLINDLYGFISWRKIEARQKKSIAVKKKT